MDIRKRLMLTLLPVIIVFVAAISAGYYLVSSNQISSLQEDVLQTNVKRAISAFSLWMDENIQTAAFLASSPLVTDACRGENRDKAQKWLNTIFKQSEKYENIILVNSDGICFMDTVGPGVGVDITKLPTGKKNFELAKQGKPHIGDMEKSPATGKPTFLITVPVMDGNDFLGLLGTPIDLQKYTTPFISSVSIGDSGFLYITNEKGVVLSHPDADIIMEKNLSKNDFGEKILKTREGTVSYTENDTDMMAYVGTYPQKGWKVIAAIHADAYQKPVHEIAFFIALIGICGVIVLMVLIWLVNRSILKGVGETVDDIKGFSGYITTAVEQFSESGRTLSTGTSSQAASLEEISSSLEQMSTMTRQNADNARRADQLMQETNRVAKNADQKLNDLIDTMNRIVHISEDASKIIKTIDEIAFQTNLLALNAAVEAARAGEAGAGFAVVADEVRNLALKAAQAAKNTAEQIETIVNNLHEGSQQVADSNAVFQDMMEKAGETAGLVNEITAASQDQAQGVEEINRAISDMDKVVQQHAAIAEQSASANNELKEMINNMDGLVSELSLLVGKKEFKEISSDGEELSSSGEEQYLRRMCNEKKGVVEGEWESKKEITPNDVFPLDEDF